MNVEAPEVYRHAPYDIEVEQALLGSIFVDNKAYERVSALLRPAHFYDPLHRRLFEAIAASSERRGLVITPLTLHAEMKADPGLIGVGGLSYLADLAGAAPAPPAPMEAFARILCDLALRRKLIGVGEDIIARAYHHEPGETPSGDQVAKATAALAEIENSSAGPLNIVRASALAGLDVPKREELVEGMIPRRAVSALTGDGGTGKSLLALQLAVAMQLKTKWLGRVVFGNGPVLYLSAEDELNEIHQRLAAIITAEGVGFERLDGLHIVPLVGENSLLGEVSGVGTITPTPLFEAVASYVHRLRPALVVLDTLSDVFGGDENDRVHARGFVSLLRQLAVKQDTVPLIFAHPSLSGMSSGRGTSGNTGWSNSYRGLMYLERIKSSGDVEDEPDARVLRCKKFNYGPMSGEVKLRWQNGMFVVRSQSDNVAATAKADRVFLEMLGQYTLEKRDVGASPGHGFAPAIFARDKRSEGVNRDSLRDAMNRLLASKRIVNQEVGPASKRKKRLALADQ